MAEGVLAFWAAEAEEDWHLGSLDHRNDASVYCLGVLKPKASGTGFFQRPRSGSADLLRMSVYLLLQLFRLCQCLCDACLQPELMEAFSLVRLPPL